MEKRDSFFRARRRAAPPNGLSLTELAFLIAAIMALNALAIDMMLPALGLISEDLNLAGENDRQLIIYAFVIGNGFAQLIFGPLVDRFGRRKIIMVSFAGYFAASLLSATADSFGLLLAARVAQGAATAGARVAISATVRDQVAGREMAKIMSIAITVFMIAPIIAPSIGQGVLIFADWRWIFATLLAFGGVIGAWCFVRLPETLKPGEHQPLSGATIFNAYRFFFTHRIAMSYSAASALCFGGLYTYIATSEQVFLEMFELGNLFGLVFAVIAMSLAAASILNSRLVGRYGMRPLTHYAIVLLLGANIVHAAMIAIFGDHVGIYIPFMAISFFSLGLIAPNCSALAMEPMGHVAGYASAAFGFGTTTVSGIIGMVIGLFFTHSTLPIAVGFVIFSAFGVALILWAEQGRLFHSRDAEQEATIAPVS